MANRSRNTVNTLVCLLFLAVESVFYVRFVIIGATNGREMDVVSVAIAFVFSVFVFLRTKHDFPITAGMFFTVIADVLLAFCTDRLELGVLVFLLVQTVYYLFLVRTYRLRIRHTVVRLCLSAAAAVAPLVVLGENANFLAVIATVYAVNLVHNLAVSLFIKEERLFSLALFLFLLCDLTLGLYQMDGFLDVSGSAFIRTVTKVDCWYYYLPSQVLIPLTPFFRKRNGVF
ncbi:MAG: hypothetical protein MJ082_01260 [Clostridia bacterium]|nr:hypothetical protein [Clostridia bacterium]